MRITLEIPDRILHDLLDGVPVPEMARVRYDIPTPPPIEDVAAAVAEQLRRPEIAGAIAPGQRVAIGVGSRGVGRLAEITAGLVAGLRALGAEPFVVPAMGSHGGATAEGQREVLARLGVTEAGVGAPIAPTWRPRDRSDRGRDPGPDRPAGAGRRRDRVRPARQAAHGLPRRLRERTGQDGRDRARQAGRRGQLPRGRLWRHGAAGFHCWPGRRSRGRGCASA